VPRSLRKGPDPEELGLSWPGLIALRLSVLGIALLTRILDLALVLWRPRLLPAYLRIWWAEWVRSPYRWPSSFEVVRSLKSTGQSVNELCYGETPLLSAIWLFRRAGLKRGDLLVDVGAGRGRVLLAARWLGARARGVELLRDHVTPVAESLGRAGAELTVGDAGSAPLEDATHVYLNWCAFSAETKQRIVNQLRATRPGTRILAVTRAVDDPRFVPRSSHRLLYTWGTEVVWVQEHVPEGERLPRADPPLESAG
jgi:hypothetical protein